MKTVYVVYGRIEWAEVACAIDGENRFEESNIYGVFTSYDAALEKFKSCVAKAMEYSWEDNTPFAFFGCEERAMEAELFANYNMDTITDATDCEPDVGWECTIDTDYAKWVMTANLNYDEWEHMILPSLYIKKEELND